MTISSLPPRVPPTPPAAAPATERTRLLRLMLPLSLLLLLVAPPAVAGAKGPDGSQPDLNPDQGGFQTGTLVAVRAYFGISMPHLRRVAALSNLQTSLACRVRTTSTVTSARPPAPIRPSS